MDDRNFIRKYVKADSKQKVDIIFRHYSDFMGIIDGYTEGLRYMIECEKDYNHRAAKGDLGVRVQSGGSISDPTAAYLLLLYLPYFPSFREYITFSSILLGCL